MSKEKNLTVNVLQYQGSKVAIEEINGKQMINATQMAKPFGKTTKDWLRTQQAKELLKTVAVRQMCLTADLKTVRQGGTNQGTWFHEDVALLFAQWLSPDFYLACNAKLKELLSEEASTKALQTFTKHGITPVLLEGKALYPYRQAVDAVGGSGTASASRRKRKYPEHFVKIFNRNFITGAYFDLLKGYYDYRAAASQLKLDI